MLPLPIKILGCHPISSQHKTPSGLFHWSRSTWILHLQWGPTHLHHEFGMSQYTFVDQLTTSEQFRLNCLISTRCWKEKFLTSLFPPTFHPLLNRFRKYLNDNLKTRKHLRFKSKLTRYFPLLITLPTVYSLRYHLQISFLIISEFKKSINFNFPWNHEKFNLISLNIRTEICRLFFTNKCMFKVKMGRGDPKGLWWFLQCGTSK